MEAEEYMDSEVDADSDHEDPDDPYAHSHYFRLGQGGDQLHFHVEDCSETGVVPRRVKTIVTPKMAMESFRLSFLNDDQDVNFDAILGELSELENQLTSTHTHMSHSLTATSAASSGIGGKPEDGGETPQDEMDAMTTEMALQRLAGYGSSNSQLLVPGPYNKHMSDAGETDSAFSDNSSLPSSESYTSMATVSSSTETTSSSSGGETCSITSAMSSTTLMNEEEQMQRMKAEKIRIALEKIKEAKIRKLFVRAFAKDGSSKSILVDEKMTVGEVCSMLADKHHRRRTHPMVVVEFMPELCMERILEDHDSLVENMVMWTRDSKNKILFEERPENYDFFFHPEKYLLAGSSSSPREMNASQREHLIQDFFSASGAVVPEVEGALYLKADGKKTWKKCYFELRASGLYYNHKSNKANKTASKELVCLVQLELVEVYTGLGWKKKYHSPTDFCFALKHPQIQKKTSKYIRYFCAESSAVADLWIMGIRLAKLGKQMLHNFEHVHHEIATWDLRHAPPTSAGTVHGPTCGVGDNPYSSPSHPSNGGGGGGGGGGDHGSGGPRSGSQGAEHGHHYQTLNQVSLQESRMSVPEASSHHTVVKVHSTSLVRSGGVGGGSHCYNPDEVVGIEVTTTTNPSSSATSSSSTSHHRYHRQGSEGEMEGSSSSGHKTPTKRVSFCATHSVITESNSVMSNSSGDRKHRDSIISDSSEDSNSSGEGRHCTSTALRGKMRPKLPVTTETTRFLTEMNQLSIDSDAPTGREGLLSLEETSSLSSTSSSSCRQVFSRSDRRRASMTERRGSDANGGRKLPPVRSHSIGGGDNAGGGSSRRPLPDGCGPDPLSPTCRQSGTQRWVEEYHHQHHYNQQHHPQHHHHQDANAASTGEDSGPGSEDPQQHSRELYSPGGSCLYQQMSDLRPQPQSKQQHQQQEEQQRPCSDEPQRQSPPHYEQMKHNQQLHQQQHWQQRQQQYRQYYHQNQQQQQKHARQEYQQQLQHHPQQYQQHYGHHYQSQQHHHNQQYQHQSSLQQQQYSKQQKPHTSQQQYQQPPPYPSRKQYHQQQQQHNREQGELRQPQDRQQQHQQDLNSGVYATIGPLPGLCRQRTSSSSAPSFSFEELSEDNDLLPGEDLLPPPPPPLLLESLAPLPPPPSHSPPKLSAPPTAPKPPSSSSSPLSPTSSLKEGSPAVLPKSALSHTLCSPGSVCSHDMQSPHLMEEKGLSSTGPPLVQSCTSLGASKVGPPTLPKTLTAPNLTESSGHGSLKYVRSLSSPASAPKTLPCCQSTLPYSISGEQVSEMGSLKYTRSASSPSRQTSILSTSAPPTLSKSDSGLPGYQGLEGRYGSLQHPSAAHMAGGVGSAPRGSHTKHPSIGSPTLVLGPNPPLNNLGPSPSDSGFIEGDSMSLCSGSPINPVYMYDFPRRLREPSPGTSPPRSAALHEDPAAQLSASISSHRRSSSAGSALVKGGTKAEAGRRAPPPPPKRSETTRLSSDLGKQVSGTTPPTSPLTQNIPSQPRDPIYENCEGIMDISDLPPPPPELLAGLPQSAVKNVGASGSSQRVGRRQYKHPPPPPKRSKDTHLSQPH